MLFTDAKVLKIFGHLYKKQYFCTAFCVGRCKLIHNFIFLSSMNQYETVFILTPVLSDEQMKEAVAKFKNLLIENGADILNEEIWGLKKLAYNIQKKSSGFYAMLEFNAEPSVVKTLETGFRRDEKVIRFITIKQDKYSAAYAEKRRAKWAAVKEA